MKNQYRLLKKEGYIRGGVVTGIGKNYQGNTCLEMTLSTPKAPGTYIPVINGVAKKVGQSKDMYNRNMQYKTPQYPDKETGEVRKVDRQHNKLWKEMFDAVKQGSLVEIFYKVRGKLYFNEELQKEVWALDGPLTEFETNDRKKFGVTEYK